MSIYELHHRPESDYLYFIDSKGAEWGAEAFITAYHNEVVYLPDTQTGLMPLIVDAFPKYNGTSVKEIDVGIYDELKALYQVNDKTRIDLTENWYAEWATDQEGYGSNHLSKRAWKHLYRTLTFNAGFNLDDMVQGRDQIANAWKTGTASDVLDDLNISYASDLSQEELLDKAMKAIAEDDTSHLSGMYVEEVQTILVYSIG